MDVKLDHREVRKGLILKTTYHEVELSVTFSREERAVIKKNRIGRLLMIERVPPADVPTSEQNISKWDLYVRALLKGPDKYLCASPADAIEYEHTLVEGLEALKSQIVAYADGASSKTFEL